MFAYCLNNPVNHIDPNGYEPITLGVVSTALLVAGVLVASYYVVKLSWQIASLISDFTYTTWSNVMYVKEGTEPEPPDVTYPGDDPTKAPDGYEWRGPDPQGGDRGGYANPKGKDSWHPDLNHPDGVDPHWDYNDGRGHKWRVFPDHIEFAP